jgi:hypothetical protein
MAKRFIALDTWRMKRRGGQLRVWGWQRLQKISLTGKHPGVAIQTWQHVRIFCQWDAWKKFREVYNKNNTASTIHNNLFSSWLTNGPNKLHCCITQGWKGLPGPNTLAYWVHSWVTKEKSVVDTTPEACAIQLFSGDIYFYRIVS